MRDKRGFTLIELSIVMVIIGLLAGGILVGQDLIHAAEIRATISQIEKYNAAVNTFQGKYGGLPGDLNYRQAAAFGFFTFDNSCGIGPGYSTGAGVMGCGDGNGQIENIYGPAVYTPEDFMDGMAGYSEVNGEQFAFWRHLSDAGLIDGAFGANLGTDGNPTVTTTDVSQYFPPAKVGHNMYFVVGSSNANNYFVLGVLATVNSGNAALWGTVPFPGATGLTPLDASNIDTKLDDGMPNTGSVRSTGLYWNYAAGPYGPGYAAWITSFVNDGNWFCIIGGSSQTDPADVYNTLSSDGGSPCGLTFRFN